MHLEPTTPVRTDDRPGNTPAQHGAAGSDARLAVLHYLANRPAGARRGAIAEAVGLPLVVVTHVLTALRQAGRVACDRRSADSSWYVPCARAALSAAALALLREQIEREAEEARQAAAAAVNGTQVQLLKRALA